MDFSTQINHIYHQLSQSEKQIVNYLKATNYQVEGLTSQSLAQACFSSRTSVFRLLKKLGLDSFAEFKFLLKRQGEAQLAKQADFEELVTAYHLYIDQIFDKLRLRAVVKTLAKCQVLYLYGTGHEQKLEVEYLRQLLTALGKKVFVIFDKGEFDYAKAAFSPEDFFWLLSYKGEAPEAISMLNDSQSYGIKTLVMTCSSHNTMSQLADFQLYVPSTSIATPTRRTFEISTTFYLVIDQLYLAYFQYLQEEQP